MEIKAKCSSCNNIGKYELSEKEFNDLIAYERGSLNGYLQELFPDVPPWIRSGAIDMKSGGFCICPTCSEFDESEEE